MNDDAVQIIHVVMGRLCHFKNFSELKNLTDLNPVKQNDTRWLSTYEMCERYFRIEIKFSARLSWLNFYQVQRKRFD
jgi:hypothetical protein